MNNDYWDLSCIGQKCVDLGLSQDLCELTETEIRILDKQLAGNKVFTGTRHESDLRLQDPIPNLAYRFIDRELECLAADLIDLAADNDLDRSVINPHLEVIHASLVLLQRFVSSSSSSSSSSFCSSKLRTAIEINSSSSSSSSSSKDL